jgi:crotonobetainyl-CoA:carnitine CoA-transferase CaiB-like acyl-CoA transferase
MNTGKKSIFLDLQTAKGQSILRQLAKCADFIVESFDPGYLDSLRLGYEDLSRENPNLIMTAISAFGQTGPYRDYAGPDLICMAVGGIMNLYGDPDRRPLRMSVPQAYAHASVQAALGSLFALWYRYQTGRGQLVDVSAQEAVIWETFHNQSLWYMNRINIKREGAWRRFGSALLRMLFPCKDGYVVVYMIGGRMGAEGQQALVQWMDSEGMADDFLRNFDWDAFAPENLDETFGRQLEERFSCFFKTKTREELFERAICYKLLLAPVNTMRDLAKSDHFKFRDYWVPIYHPELRRTFFYPGAPYKSTRPHYSVRHPAPSFNRDKDDILGVELVRPVKVPASPENKYVKSNSIKRDLIFDGLRILDFSWVGVGPAAVRFFADYGADVLHVESAARPDLLRFMPPVKNGIPGIDRSAYFANYNTNKYGITLDLKNRRGLEVAKSLVAWSDVVVESFSPGVMDRLGLGYEALKAIKRDVIMASSSQLGENGPLAHFRGYGTQAAGLAGFWSVTGYEEGEPSGLYGAYCDFIAHTYLSIAIIMALEQKRQTGQGQFIDQSQVESSVHFLAPALMNYNLNGEVARPQGNHDPNAAPHNAYPCEGEDCWCAIAVFTDRQWQALKEVMGYPPWASEERFATLCARKKHEVELDSLIDDWTGKYEAHHLMTILQKAGVPAGIVARAEDLHKDPQLAHRKHFSIVDHAIIGSYPCDAPAFRFSIANPRVRMPSPCLGEHNEFVVTKMLSFSNEEFLRLKTTGAFG